MDANARHDNLRVCLCTIENASGYEVGTMPCPKHSPIGHAYEHPWTAPDGTRYIKRWRLDERRRRVLNFVPAALTSSP